MNQRRIALLCAVGAALLLVACGGAQPSPAPIAQAQPSATPVAASATPAPPTAPPQPTVDVAAIQTAAAATAQAQMAKELTATAISAAATAQVEAEKGTAIAAAAAATIEQQGKNATATAGAIAAQATATAAAIPTATTAPTRPPVTRAPTVAPTAAFTLDLRNMRYEQWGRPVRGCLAFDNSRPVRKFNLEITLTNNTGAAIEEWFPDFYANNGSLLWTCWYFYGDGFPTVPPGESREVTFAAFCEPEEYVAEMKVKINDQEIRRCFGPEGALIACP